MAPATRTVDHFLVVCPVRRGAAGSDEGSDGDDDPSAATADRIETAWFPRTATRAEQQAFETVPLFCLDGAGGQSTGVVRARAAPKGTHSVDQAAQLTATPAAWRTDTRAWPPQLWRPLASLDPDAVASPCLRAFVLTDESGERRYCVALIAWQQQPVRWWWLGPPAHSPARGMTASHNAHVEAGPVRCTPLLPFLRPALLAGRIAANSTRTTTMTTLP